MREILVQSDLVSVLLNLLFSIKYIYKTFANTCIYININSMQIDNTINIPIKQFLRHFCEYQSIFILKNIYFIIKYDG